MAVKIEDGRVMIVIEDYKKEVANRSWGRQFLNSYPIKMLSYKNKYLVFLREGLTVVKRKTFNYLSTGYKIGDKITSHDNL